MTAEATSDVGPTVVDPKLQPELTSLGIKFLRRTGMVLAVVAGVGCALYASKWGLLGAVACFAWCALWALGLGFLGFQTLRHAMTCDLHKMAVVTLGGFLGRLFVLAVSQSGVYFLISPQWGQRTLITTTVLYMFVLAVEVLTLNEGLKGGNLTRPPASRED